MFTRILSYHVSIIWRSFGAKPFGETMIPETSKLGHFSGEAIHSNIVKMAPKKISF